MRLFDVGWTGAVCDNKDGARFCPSRLAVRGRLTERGSEAPPSPKQWSTDGRRQRGVRSPFTISRMRQANREGWCGTTGEAWKARVGG